MTLMGSTPQVHKPCVCPASRPKKEPRVSDRYINGLMDREDLTCLEQGPGVTPHWVQPMLVRALNRSSLPRGKGRLPVIGGTDIRLAHQLTGTPLTASFIRMITSWGKYVERSVLWLGCRCSWHWSSWGCLESKRTATLSGLNVQSFFLSHLPSFPLSFHSVRPASQSEALSANSCSPFPFILHKCFSQ